jgi:uncharacterized protein (DUF433 family)
MTVEELEEQLLALDPAEQAQVFQRLALELTHAWPGIEKTTGVVGGDACIVRTRIPVWLLESYRRLGWSEAQLLANFPTLRAADLAYAWLYAAAHPEEIETALPEQAEVAITGELPAQVGLEALEIGTRASGEVVEGLERLLSDVEAVG